jgi:hypothetical protein
LAEWWRAGGKLLYQENEAKRVKRMHGAGSLSRPSTFGSIESPSSTELVDFDDPFKNLGVWAAVAAIILKLFS